MDYFQCPICDNSHKTLVRYSDAVCNTCLHKFKTMDKNNNIIRFYNNDIMSGSGIKAIVNNKTVTDF